MAGKPSASGGTWKVSVIIGSVFSDNGTSETAYGSTLTFNPTFSATDFNASKTDTFVNSAVTMALERSCPSGVSKKC